MTPELDSKPDDLETEVDEILQAVDDQLSALDEDETPSEDAFAELRNIGGRASELVEDTDPKSLLVAVDSSEDAPDPEKDSLATVMSKSAPESVAKLRTILTLSKLPDVDDGTLTDRVEQIRDLRSLSRKADTESEGDVDAEAERDADEDEPTGTDVADEGDADAESTEHAETKGDEESNGDADSGGGGAEGGSDADDASDAAAGSDADADDDAETDPSEQVKQRLRSRLDEFRNGVEEYRASLTEDDEDERDEADDDSESGRGDGRSSGRRAGTTFSTIPSRKRGDMTTGTTRFSTMRPSKNRRN